MDETQFKDYLLQRYLKNQATDEELEVFFHLIEQDQLDDTLTKYMEIEANAVTDIQPVTKTNSPVRTLWRWSIAASVVLIAAAGIYFAQSSGLFNNQPLATSNKQEHDIAPGGNKATLILSDGSKIILDEAETGTLANQGNTAILKSRDGQLIYDASQSAGSSSGTVTYNTISTPRGGQYQVILPDGSKIWLNAASSVKFPTAFTGNERNITITGEAYFEVAKDVSKPFKVDANGTVVQVLGTHFNVMAYHDEHVIRTTLLEGSVKLIHSNTSVLLKPGEQGSITENASAFDVNKADVKATVAWKNGYFQFEDSDLPELMRQLARWYDVDIEYEGKIPPYEFVGQIERNSSLSKVLEILKQSDINFKIVGKKLIVSPPNGTN